MTTRRTEPKPRRMTAPKAVAARPKPGKPHSVRLRFDVPDAVRILVWIRAAGHCEQCGADLTVDLRSGQRLRWGDAAHILPAALAGPRAPKKYTAADAARLSQDPDNLMLLCPGDHRRTDGAASSYPTTDLVRHHAAHLEQIRHAARRGETQRAQGLIILSKHFATENSIAPRDLQDAMLSEGLWADERPVVHTLPLPGRDGRDVQYWQSVERSIDEHLADRLKLATSRYGDPRQLCVAALADIPSLIRVGRQLGDRSNHVVYSPLRGHKLRWPNLTAAAPVFSFDADTDRGEPIALVLSLSATIPDRDVRAALPVARLARFTTPEPAYHLVQNRGVIHAFRQAIQVRLSALEAATDQPIHLFAAIPAALALELGALLSTQHAHRYIVYDREGDNAFVPAMELGPRRASPAVSAAHTKDATL